MAGLLAPQIKFRYTDNNGNPLVAGKVYTYISGTNTLITTYSDSALSVANTNPVVLDSRGECDIYLSPGKAYRFTVKDSNDATLETTDGIYGASPAGSSSWYDITAYGADPGATAAVNTAAIRAAMTAAVTAGGTLYVPRGNYSINDDIPQAGNVRMLGDGNDSVITQTDINKNFITATGDVNYSVYSDMQWVGAGAATGGTGMGFSGYTAGANVRISFLDLNINQWPQCAIYLPDSFCCTIRVRISNCGTKGTIAGGNAELCSDSYGGGIRYGRITFTGSACTGNSTNGSYIRQCGRGIYVDGNERVLSHDFDGTKVESSYIGIDVDGRDSAIGISRFNTMDASTYFEANLYAGALMGEGTANAVYRNNTTAGTGLPGSWSKAGPDGVNFLGRYNIFYDNRVQIGNELATANPIAIKIDKDVALNYISEMRVNSLGGLKLTDSATQPDTEVVALYAGSGSPEAGVSAQTGSLYLRHNGTYGGNTVYIKLTGDGTNTGWFPLGFIEGTTVSRPAAVAANKGQLFYDSDILRTVVSNGSGTWREYNGLTTVKDTYANIPSGVQGAQFWADDLNTNFIYDGSIWRAQYYTPVTGSVTNGGTTTMPTRGGVFLGTTTGAAVATHTLSLPSAANSASGDRCVFTVTNGITALTVSSSATIVNAPTTMTASQTIEFMYNTGSTTWFRTR